MNLYLVKTPIILQRLFRSYSWRFRTLKKEIYLTFDDGPTPEITNWVLSELEKHNAKATFFCIGKNIQQYPQIFNNIIAGNHSVGNHTHNHKNGFQTDLKSYVEDVLEAQLAFNQQKKEDNSSILFRPPYGKIKRKQARKLQNLGYKIVMWDVLSADFDNAISKEKCLNNVLKNTEKGSIIVFHDSVKASEKLHHALPKVLEYFSKKGYIFKAINS